MTHHVERKAQIPQVFIILMAILVIGATLYIGAKLLFWITPTACGNDLGDFPARVQAALDERSSYGSHDEATLDAPCDSLALCFVDSRAIGDTAFTSTADADAKATIESSVRGTVQSDVFLERRDGTQTVMFDDRILLVDASTSPLPPPLHNDVCVPAKNGKFTFTTDGFGRYIEISQS